MTYCHLQADCLYTGISSGPNARYRVWEAFTFAFILLLHTLTRYFIRTLRYVASNITRIDVSAARQVGFNRGDGVLYFEHQFSVTPSVLYINAQTNVGVEGRWLYRVDGNADTPEPAQNATCSLPSTAGKPVHRSSIILVHGQVTIILS